MDGTVSHDIDCNASKHELPIQISRAVRTLERKTYTIAVWSNPLGVLNNQPVFLGIEPKVDKCTFPKHPHINEAGFLPYQGKIIFVPYSICYLHDLSNLGYTEDERILEAFKQVCIWLVKHQLWETLITMDNFKNNPYDAWIGESQYIPSILEMTNPCYDEKRQAIIKKTHQNVTQIIKKSLF